MRVLVEYQEDRKFIERAITISTSSARRLGD